MNPEVHYTHMGTHEGEAGLWIGVAVSRVTREQQETVEIILEGCRDALTAALGLWDNTGEAGAS